MPFCFADPPPVISVFLSVGAVDMPNIVSSVRLVQYAHHGSMYKFHPCETTKSTMKKSGMASMYIHAVGIGRTSFSDFGVPS